MAKLGVTLGYTKNETTNETTNDNSQSGNIGNTNSNNRNDVQVGPKDHYIPVAERIKEFKNLPEKIDALNKLSDDVKQNLISHVNANGGSDTVTYYDKATKQMKDVDITTVKQADGSYKLYVDRDNTGWSPDNHREAKHEVKSSNEIFELGHLFKGYPVPDGVKIGVIHANADTNPDSKNVASADAPPQHLVSSGFNKSGVEEPVLDPAQEPLTPTA